MDAMPAPRAGAAAAQNLPSDAGQIEVWTFEELRLRCDAAGITPMALLKRAGVAPSNLFHWRRGRLPALATLRKIMKAFPEEARRETALTETWGFEELLRRSEDAGVDLVALLKRAGVNPNSLFYWRRGRVPKGPTMRKIMTAFPTEARRAKLSPPVWTVEELLRRCEQAGVKPGALLKRARLEKSNLSFWRRGRVPTAPTMRKLMKAFPKEARRVAMSRVSTSDRKSQGCKRHDNAPTPPESAGNDLLLVSTAVLPLSADSSPSVFTNPIGIV